MKQIYAVVRHDLSSFEGALILDYFSTKKKALCNLKKIAALFGVEVCESSGSFTTQVIDYRGSRCFYCLREYDLL